MTTRWQREEPLRGLTAALRAMRARIEALMDESEERDRRERVLAAAFQELEQRVLVLERRTAAPARMPTTAAAKRLGLSPASVRRLIEAGELEGLALQLQGSSRKVWVVELQSLERFERARGVPVGALGAASDRIAGQRSRTNGG